MLSEGRFKRLHTTSPSIRNTDAILGQNSEGLKASEWGEGIDCKRLQQLLGVMEICYLDGYMTAHQSSQHYIPKKGDCRNETSVNLIHFVPLTKQLQPATSWKVGWLSADTKISVLCPMSSFDFQCS